MSQTPITVTYSLEEVLGEIKQSIKELNQKLDNNQKEVNQRLDRIDERLNKIEVGQARLEKKVDGLGKRLDNQEFINRGVLVGLILALLGGLAKLFGLIGNP